MRKSKKVWFLIAPLLWDFFVFLASSLIAGLGFYYLWNLSIVYMFPVSVINFWVSLIFVVGSKTLFLYWMDWE